MAIMIQVGAVHRPHPHRIRAVSFAHHRVDCGCGETIRVHRLADEPRASVDGRLADKFRIHRTADEYARKSHH